MLKSKKNIFFLIQLKSLKIKIMDKLKDKQSQSDEDDEEDEEYVPGDLNDSFSNDEADDLEEENVTKLKREKKVTKKRANKMIAMTKRLIRLTKSTEIKKPSVNQRTLL